LEVVRANPRTGFFFLTKNPVRYFEFLDRMPENARLGATVETNRDEGYERISRAPKPSERLEAMAGLDWPRKVIVVEPVLDLEGSPRR
jgi:DNA repair photolyase